jgi:acetaldehyde dehydrogenase
MLGIPVTAKGIKGIEDMAEEIALVFDATSAADHLEHATILENLGIRAVDLTPAKIGRRCVPAVNLDECLDLPNVNMITCGGQASIPLAHAIAQANPNLEYIETVSSIASRSAGPATRINLDEYLLTTETGLSFFSSCKRTKAILNLNPAQPCVHMQTTVMAKVDNPDIEETRKNVSSMIERIQGYVPGYRLIIEPVFESGRLITIVGVDGLGDYLPKYAGNLDIINCAAIAYAEAYSSYIS